MFNIHQKSIKVTPDQIDIPIFEPKKQKEKSALKKFKERFLVLRSKTYQYIRNECNANFVNKSNLPILVDNATKSILLIAKNDAKLCLSSIDANIIKEIAMESGYERYNVDIKNE